MKLILVLLPLVLILGACNKPALTVTDPTGVTSAAVVTTPAVMPKVTNPTDPVVVPQNSLPKETVKAAPKVNTPAIAKAKVVGHTTISTRTTNQETAAYAKAKANAARAACLIKTVDAKLDRDAVLGQMRDFGNILDHTTVCQS